METPTLVRSEKPEASEEKPLLSLQIARLQRLYAVNAAMAEALAPLVFIAAVRS